MAESIARSPPARTPRLPPLSRDGIYAIGDVVRGPMLAHKASEEVIACVEHIVTGFGHVNDDDIPGIVYTHPEFATVGKTEDELVETKVPYRKGVFPRCGILRSCELPSITGVSTR